MLATGEPSGEQEVVAWAVLAVGLALAASGAGAAGEGYARKIASLIEPAKLATLKAERAANPRVQKYVALLAKCKSSKVA